MEDTEIIELYWQRDPEAIAESRRKYGAYCFTTAKNLLADSRDAEECVNDTFLGAWNAIPPHRPRILRLFLAKITRNLAFNCYLKSSAQKRGSGELPLVLEELDQCISGGEDPEQILEARQLEACIQAFVRNLNSRERSLFVRRYFFTESVSAIAADTALSPNHVSVILKRVRQRLREHLIREGFCHE